MSHLQDIQSDAYDKLCQVGPQRWSRAHCLLVRYNYLTSNSVESVNACTIVYRKLPVLKLAETYHEMVQDWCYKRRKLAGPCLSWWMYVLKECIGDNPSLLFISDRHAAIALAVQNEFPLVYHVVCCLHLMMNLSLKRDKTKALFWKICKAYTTEEFSSSMSHLQDIQSDAYDKLCQVGPQRWSRAHCLLVRYNYLTSNSVESVNACTIVYRKLPVLKLAETYHEMVQDWCYKRRKLAENLTHEITDWATNKVKKMMKSAKWVVCGVSDHQYQVTTHSERIKGLISETK
nr:transposase, MuDR, MULE transposase domain protein [Tanacetum cinerariifolium]